ncbi:hypothetical protein BDV12DRAFT_201336 [Aspergillus spectabilis]
MGGLHDKYNKIDENRIITESEHGRHNRVGHRSGKVWQQRRRRQHEGIDPCTLTHAALDAIESNASSIPDYCMITYLVGVQQATLNKSLANYTDITNNGYHDRFDAYSGYIKELVSEELKSYMAANASRYVTCKTETYIYYANVRSDCPDTIPEPDSDTFQAGIFPVIYECNDEDSFHDLDGILPSWIEFGKFLVQYYSFPIWIDFGVPDPKDLILSSLTNLTIINDMLVDAYTNMYINIWTMNKSAAVDSATLPTSMTKCAVQSMAKVSAECAAIEAAKKKEIILSFVDSVRSLSRLPHGSDVGREPKGVGHPRSAGLQRA